MTAQDQNARDVVRDLAKRVAELAHTPENAWRQTLWCDVNSLRKPERAPVICNIGSGALEELLPRKVVVAQDPYLASIEYGFRKLLHKWELGDDTVIDPWMEVGTAMRLEGQHLWGLPVKHIDTDRPDVSRTAWMYDPPIKDEKDIERIVLPRYHHDPKATDDNLSRMDDLLGDILPVKRTCAVPGAGAWLHGWATQLRGVQQLLLDMMDRPEWTHRLMRTLMEGHLGVMDQYESAGVLTLNNVNKMACDDLPQPDHDGQHVRLCDLWGRGESQEFQAVSPAQHEEFLLRYQLPILERFGLTFYGCCEDLTNKIDLILTIPNLRRFVCSPWTDIGKLAQALGDRYCIEWRQKATDVVYAADLREQEKHLERGLRLAERTPVMIVLQELETVNGHMSRLSDWAAMAKDLAARCAG